MKVFHAYPNLSFYSLSLSLRYFSPSLPRILAGGLEREGGLFIHRGIDNFSACCELGRWTYNERKGWGQLREAWQILSFESGFITDIVKELSKSS